ncbi:hypothetical protein GGER_44130 [Serratia rubidaea]
MTIYTPPAVKRDAPGHSMMGGLPPRAGVGLKPEHFGQILQTRPDVGFLKSTRRIIW